MKPILKNTLTALGCLASFIMAIIIVLAIIAFIPPHENRIAKDPAKIADEVGFDLPAYTIIKYSDNFDRNSSAWSAVEYTLKLKDFLSEESLDELNELVKKDGNWRYVKESNQYIYSKGDWADDFDPEIIITISLNADIVYVYFTWWDMLV